MRLFLFLLIIIHGLIHLTGFGEWEFSSYDKMSSMRLIAIGQK